MTSAIDEPVTPASLDDEERKPRRRRGRIPGAPARWTILYDAMIKLAPGDLLCYEDMGELLGLDFQIIKQRNVINAAARRAADEATRRKSMVFRIMRGHGYQVAEPTQVLELARNHQSRAMREVGAGATKVATIDTSQVDVTMAKIVEATQMSLTRQQAYMASLDVRQKRLAIAVAALGVQQAVTQSTVDKTLERVDATQEQIARLERELEALKQQPPAAPPSGARAPLPAPPAPPAPQTPPSPQPQAPDVPAAAVSVPAATPEPPGAIPAPAPRVSAPVGSEAARDAALAALAQPPHSVLFATSRPETANRAWVFQAEPAAL